MINRYTSENDTEYGEEDCLTEFLAENEIDSFGSLSFEISQCDVKNVKTYKKKQRLNR